MSLEKELLYLESGETSLVSVPIEKHGENFWKGIVRYCETRALFEKLF